MNPIIDARFVLKIVFLIKRFKKFPLFSAFAHVKKRWVIVHYSFSAGRDKRESKRITKSVEGGFLSSLLLINKEAEGDQLVISRFVLELSIPPEAKRQRLTISAGLHSTNLNCSLLFERQNGKQPAMRLLL